MPPHAGLKFLVQDYVSETDGGVLHSEPPSESYFAANNIDADVLRLSARSLLQQRVRSSRWHGSAWLATICAMSLPCESALQFGVPTMLHHGTHPPRRCCMHQQANVSNHADNVTMKVQFNCAGGTCHQ